MISAHEARELIKTSQVNLDALLAALDIEVQKAATLGKGKIFLTDALPYNEDLRIEHRQYYPPVMTAFQQILRNELKKLGYSLQIVSRHVQVSGGFGSMEDAKYEDRPFLELSW